MRYAARWFNTHFYLCTGARRGSFFLLSLVDPNHAGGFAISLWCCNTDHLGYFLVGPSISCVNQTFKNNFVTCGPWSWREKTDVTRAYSKPLQWQSGTEWSFLWGRSLVGCYGLARLGWGKRSSVLVFEALREMVAMHQPGHVVPLSFSLEGNVRAPRGEMRRDLLCTGCKQTVGRRYCVILSIAGMWLQLGM